MPLFGSTRVLAILKAVVAALVVVIMSHASASAQADAPTVTDTSPDNAATGVALDTDVTATFSREMDQSTVVTDPSTLTSTNVKLYERVKKKIRRHGEVRRVWRWRSVSAAQVSYDSQAKTVTLNPYGDSDTLLAPNRQYRAVITTGAKDVDGNALAQNYSWTFSTGTS